MSKKFTDEELVELLALKYSNRAVAKILQVDESTVRARIKTLIKRGWSPSHDMTHLVPDGFKIKGVSTLYDKNGQPSIQWVKSSEDKERQVEIIKEMCKAFSDSLPQFSPKNCELPLNDNILAVYPVGDPHIGMMSWGEETGEDWNLKLAEEVMIKTFSSLCASVPTTKNAVIAFLGDNFHYDNIAGVTTRSHNVLDRDNRYGKMVRVGMRIVRSMIENLLEYHKTVTVIISRGNHDDATSIFLREALVHVYENEPRIVIDNSPGMFHYYKHGINLLGFHHGDTCKMDKLPGVMACDRSQDWGDSKYRHWMTGHIHKSIVRDEQMGCVVESFNIMAPTDAYAYEGGWRSSRNVQCLLYDKEKGPRGRRIENL